MQFIITTVCHACRTRLSHNFSIVRNVSFVPRLKIYNTHRYRYLTTSSSDAHTLKEKRKKIDLSEFPAERIRNFSIIAHVDHGKSTLADRLLEFTGTISSATKNEQVLDKLQVERERGITVKAQTASIFYEHNGQTYLLNLIDTPGHVDFNYEVSRSLRACQGVILLVDANQGVQAQTVANFYLAFESELTIIPVLNKIDLKVAKPEVVAKQMQNLFDFNEDDIIKVSAKLGIGVEEVLKAVVERIPPPVADLSKPLKVLLFDSWYDQFRGAVCSIAVTDGSLRRGDRIVAAHSQKSYETQEVGIMYPDETATNVLYAGQVGYLYASMKTTAEAQVGDTLYHQKVPVEPFPGFKPAKPMVFAGVFPIEQIEFPALRSAIEKLSLNDTSVQLNKDSSAILGQGWRLGFLGLLHMDVFCQRLEQEYNANVIITSPNVPYKVKITGTKNIKNYGGDEVTVLNPCHLPDQSMVTEYLEPMVMGTIISPDDYIGQIISLILDRRGEQEDQVYIDDKRIMFKAIFPLNEIVLDFFDELKSVTSGYASFDYEDIGYRPAKLVKKLAKRELFDKRKIDIVLNGNEVEEFAQIAHVSKAREVAKRMTSKLKECIPSQLFVIAIQAKINAKVISRENIKAMRKDVLAKCYGGDITRKMKLLKRQAEGKKKMRRIGNVEVPKEAFITIVRR